MLEAGVVIGCDGSASSIRAEMLKLNRFNFSQQYLDYGYKELTIPAGPRGEHLLETNALHIWPRGNHMLIALPNIDGTFACILFLPFEGADSFAGLTTPAQVDQFFESRFPDAVPLMPQLADNYFANPTGAMVTIKCSPWHVEGQSAASRRCGSCHRSVLWPGNELRLRRLHLSCRVARPAWRGLAARVRRVRERTQG